MEIENILKNLKGGCMNFNKSLLIAVTLLTVSLKADDYRPRFKDTYIEVAARGTRCGSFRITPKSGQGIITLKSYVFYSDTPGGSTFSTSGEVGTLDLDSAGKKIRYDSAGAGAQTHYRIYCSKRSKTFDLLNPVSCQDVVTVESTNHNDACLADAITGVGISAGEGYKDLKMNQANY